GELGKCIVYDPAVLVYHHRRRLFVPHLRQHARYGFHRGMFARSGSVTSLRPGYFIPTAFTLALVLAPLVLTLSHGPLLIAYAAWLAAYGLALGATTVWVWTKERRISVAVLAGVGILATHLVYGVAFACGFAAGRP